MTSYNCNQLTGKGHAELTAIEGVYINNKHVPLNNRSIQRATSQRKFVEPAMAKKLCFQHQNDLTAKRFIYLKQEQKLISAMDNREKNGADYICQNLTLST